MKPKFRVWDVKRKRMFYPEFLVENDYGVLIPAYSKSNYRHEYYVDNHVYTKNQKELVLMQFTGIYDIDNVKIYDEDILEFKLKLKGKREKTCYGRVVSLDACYVIITHDYKEKMLFMYKMGINTSIVLEDGEAKKFKVVGNFYEDPDLFKEV